MQSQGVVYTKRHKNVNVDDTYKRAFTPKHLRFRRGILILLKPSFWDIAIAVAQCNKNAFQ